MRHIIFEEDEYYNVGLLMKFTAFNKQEIIKNYVEPLNNQGIKPKECIAFTLDYDDNGKAPVKHIKDYLGELLPILDNLKVKYLYVADANYFKVLIKQTKADSNLGYVMPCAIKGYEHMKVVLGVNYQQLIYNPDLQTKLDQGLNALASDLNGAYQAPGTGIIHSAYYPESVQDIAKALEKLHSYPELTADIEAFSLRFDEAGIGTISFAWDKHNGIAFKCDYVEMIPSESMYGFKKVNSEVRKLLYKFFTTYKGKLTWHHAGYDVKVILYTLFMKDYGDQDGLINGIDIMCKNMDDTKLIAYLATNSTAGNTLGLKPLAQEFAGNWGIDEIKDIRKIKPKELLQYNLVDALSTWYVKDKYYPIMVQDNQLNIYNTIFLPSVKTILQMELTGMPMDIAKLRRAKRKLSVMKERYLNDILNTGYIQTINLILQDKAWNKDYETRVAKAKNPDKIQRKDRARFDELGFNPNSPNQLQELLYKLMNLPVIDFTDTGLPATGGETIEKLIHHTTDKVIINILNALIGYNRVTKILSGFIPAFERGIIKAKDGIIWLHGSMNLGGTVSGRLSSSDPNLQNLPSTSTFAKLIKDIFRAPKGWLFCGADFNSLEDMISALTTKDSNKLAVYTQGFDGHSLRAAYYFKEELIAEGLNIDITDPKSVNILKLTDHPLRSKSKAPTFALTYQGTWITLVNNLGWTKEFAQGVEKNYHILYAESDAYIQTRLKQASVDGYVEVAFGLRVRTPMLKQVMFGSSRMPKEAAAEGRTAGNAMGQSYGQLNNRAVNAFMEKVWKSKYRLDILPVVLIHDAIYLLVREDVEVLTWVNKELIGAMEWCDLPELYHPTVKIGAALDVFWPSWANKITLPNNASEQDIIDACIKGKDEYLNPKPKDK